MTYLGLLEVLASAAVAADSTATYHRGRLQDVSLESVTSQTNLIYAEDTMQPKRINDSVEEWRIRLGFLRQDSTSSESMEANQAQVNEESRETIFSETLIVARRFLSALENEDDLVLTKEPQLTQVTRVLQGTFTGWGCDLFVLVEVGCDNVEIGDGIYKNSDDTFEVEIARNEVYVAPDITVTDSDGSTYEHPANKNVLCTPGGGGGVDKYFSFVIAQV